MRVVLDCNVIVSALIAPAGPSAKLVDLIDLGSLELVVSEDVVTEYRRVITYPKVASRFAADIQHAQSLLDQLWNVGIKIVPAVALQVVIADPTDDKFVACAVAGNAQYIVSTDRHLLDLGSYQGIQVLQPWELLHMLTAGPPSQQ